MLTCSEAQNSPESVEPKFGRNAPCCIESEHDRKTTFRTLHCIAINFKCSLRVCESETVLQLSNRLGKLMQCSPSELILICNGRFISRHPLFSLEALGLFASSSICKLVISQRPPGPTLLLITTIFLCSSSLSPLLFSMLAESTITSVKRRIRELLRCPVAIFSLYLSDGSELPDTVTLRELGVADGGRLYCRIRSEEQEPALPSALASTAAAVRKLVRQADAVTSGMTVCKRPREHETAEAGGANDGGRGSGDQAPLDMRRGLGPPTLQQGAAAAPAPDPPPAAHAEAGDSDLKPQPPGQA